MLVYPDAPEPTLLSVREPLDLWHGPVRQGDLVSRLGEIGITEFVVGWPPEHRTGELEMLAGFGKSGGDETIMREHRTGELEMLAGAVIPHLRESTS